MSSSNATVVFAADNAGGGAIGNAENGTGDGATDDTVDNTVVRVDAVVAFTGGTPESASEARPLLYSDIELEARLMQNGDASPHALSPEERRRAEEHAILIHLLSDQARRLHETASADEKAALFAEVAEHMGGVASMNTWLIDHGIERDALNRWVENAVLAVSQLRFLKDQAMLPTGYSSNDNASGSTRANGKPETTVKITGRDLVDELTRRLTEVAETGCYKVLR